MVSDTGNDVIRSVSRRASAREVRLEGLGVLSIVLGAAALFVFFLPGMEELAWIPAVVAVLIATADLGLKVSRRRYAIIGMMLGVVAFSWSFAMVLFGSAR